MAATTDPELIGNTIEEIGGSFALGQWLADHDPSFKNHWGNWCSGIQSAQGVGWEIAVVLEAELEVVRENDLEKRERNLVFKYVGPCTVTPLTISVEGEDLLEQTYDMLTAAPPSVNPSAIALLDEAETSMVDRPTIESGFPGLPFIANAPIPPDPQLDFTLPQLESEAPSTLVPLVGPTDAPSVIPEPAASITTFPLPDLVQTEIVTLSQFVEPALARPVIPEPTTIPTTFSLPDKAESDAITLPEVVDPAIADSIILVSATSNTTLPSSVRGQIVTLPTAVDPVVAVELIPGPPTPATTLSLPIPAEARIITLPEANEPAVAVEAIPEPATSATTLPLPSRTDAAMVALPEATEPAVVEAAIPESATTSTMLPMPGSVQAETVSLPEAVAPVVAAVVIPDPPTLALTLPQTGQAAEFAVAGQYLLPIGSFPSGETGGKTLKEAADRLDAEMPRAVSDILGHLQVRKGFMVISRQFKGLVLEVELDQPLRAFVRLSMAKEKESWTVGGEAIVSRAPKNGTPQPPLIFILKVAAAKGSKSLVMSLNGEVDLVDDLLRPMFAEKVSIPDGISLKVVNPTLVLVKQSATNGNSATKALVAVGLQMGVDFGDLPFVGEPIKAQGAAKMSLGIQYASAPFATAEIDDINSILGSDLQLTTLDGAAFDGLQLSVALQMTGKPLLLSVPLSQDKPSDKQTAPTKPGGDQSRTAVAPAAPNVSDQTINWMKVNRSVGPAYLDKVGVGFKDGAVQFRVSASVQMSGLSFFVEGLGGGLKLEWPPQPPTFNLDGLGISFEAPPISISGALIRTTINSVDSYDGMAVIKAANFTIAGLGSYSKVNGDPSLFIFAVLHKDLGGPSFFHVTGLAAGFGFNRALKLPPIEEVQNFPLVRGALEDNYFGGSSTAGALEKLRDYIPPSGGDYWFALGIRFNSFEMIQSFALLSVSFGHEVQIGLLGLSRMSLPKGANPGSAIAFAELALRAVIRPDEGSIAVEGRLTDNSYIFSKDCRLTGGFAFYTWFSGPHSGDFVITLGGYHPRFVRPAHYPIVPRLGVNWHVSSQLTITAEMYFALTPSCLMAGGKMSAVYKAGAIKAWYVAYADFLLSWQPFFYMIDMGISIGVEADLGLFSISVHISVDLHIWGPEFAGEIDVDLSVVSFTVRFGPDKAPPSPLKASEFLAAFLPPAKPVVPVTQPRAKRRMLAAQPGATQEVLATPPPTKSEALTTQINSGLLRQEAGENKEPLRVVNGHALALSVQSMIPVTSFGGLVPKDIQSSIKAVDLLGIRSMGKTKLDSQFLVNIVNDLGGPNSSIKPDRKNLRVATIDNGVPEALWGRSLKEGEVPAVAPEAKTITVTLGIQISFAPIHPKGALPAMDIQKFAYETFNKPIPWDPNLKPPGMLTGAEIQGESIDTVMSGKTIDKRNAVLNVLARQSPFRLNEVDLAELVKNRESYFQADPIVSKLGSVNESIG